MVLVYRIVSPFFSVVQIAFQKSFIINGENLKTSNIYSIGLVRPWMAQYFLAHTRPWVLSPTKKGPK